MANPIPLQERLVFPYLRVAYSKVTGLKNVETTGDRVDVLKFCCSPHADSSTENYYYEDDILSNGY